MADVELVAEEPVDRLVSLSETAEDEGFDGVWVTDHYNNRNPFVALTAIAGATEDVDIGPGITNPYYAHPAYTANAVATLDEYTGGRARLGVGPGDPNTLKALEIERDSPLYEVLDAVKLTRSLLAGEKVTEEGLTKGAKLNYETETVPVYVGAQGPNMLRMANDHGDGILINASHPDDFVWSFEQIDEADAEIVAYTSFSVSDDREEAKKSARQPVAFIASASPPPVLERHGVDAELADEIGGHIERGEFSEAFGKVTDPMLDAFSVYGTPEECGERVDALYETGVDTVVVGSPLGPEPKEALRVTSELV
jgi:5,10-methylenetetrahydromethanopterin reductase